jgi:inner membrane protein
MTTDMISPEPQRRKERKPSIKLLLTLLVGFLLSIPLFSMYLLNYDRQNQSDSARQSIVEGWGGPQTVAGPVLIIPYQAQTSETVEEGGKQVTRTSMVWRELALSPEVATINTTINPERRKRSIYEAVVYSAHLAGQARFVMPADLARIGVSADQLVFARAELRFGLSDARGLFGPRPQVAIGGKALPLEPGHGLGATGGAGFYSGLDAASLRTAPIVADFSYDVRGNESLTLSPRAGDTTWNVTSPWPNPSFKGGFLPTTRSVTASGFTATYRVGNLALGQSLINAEDVQSGGGAARASSALPSEYGDTEIGTHDVSISLVQPVDLYAQVNRATKYGFLFIGFTFLAFLMFDVIGGVRVSAVEYLLVGTGLILFFALLLAFAEVVGFTLAYVLASAAIIGLITAYSAAVLKSWRRANMIGGMLTALYAVLYILLSLEAYSLLIGSTLLFLALAGVMYATRNLDWGAIRAPAGEET